MDIRLDCVDTVPSCSLSILIVGIMLIFPFIRDSIVLIVPACSLSIFMVGIMLIFSLIRDSIVLI